MKEIRELASGMKDAIAGIRKGAIDAKGALALEMMHAQSNNAKVAALVAELKVANQEVEEFLGETRSNFTPSGEKTSATHPSPGSEFKPVHEERPHADANGVILNKG